MNALESFIKAKFSIIFLDVSARMNIQLTVEGECVLEARFSLFILAVVQERMDIFPIYKPTLENYTSKAETVKRFGRSISEIDDARGFSRKEESLKRGLRWERNT